MGVYGYSSNSFSGYRNYDGIALASMVGNKNSYTGAFKEVKSRYLDIREGTPYDAEVAMKILAGSGTVYRHEYYTRPSARSAYAVIVNGSGI